jgi:hypothetical protein
MFHLGKDDVERKFINFQDSLLKSIAIEYVGNGKKDCKISVYTAYRDGSKESWGTVDILISNVYSYRIYEPIDTTAEVISSGFHIVDIEDKTGIDLGYFAEPPKTLKELLSSDLFVLGENIKVMMRDDFS